MSAKVCMHEEKSRVKNTLEDSEAGYVVQHWNQSLTLWISSQVVFKSSGLLTFSCYTRKKKKNHMHTHFLKYWIHNLFGEWYMKDIWGLKQVARKPDSHLLQPSSGPAESSMRYEHQTCSTLTAKARHTIWTLLYTQTDVRLKGLSITGAMEGKTFG